MTLANAPLLYVFFETADLEGQRRLFESGFGFRVIEVEPHMPHHRHGVVKYDAGGVILSLNLSDATKFDHRLTDALVSVVDVGPDRLAPGTEDEGFISRRGDELVDAHGHHFRIGTRSALATSAGVSSLQLIVDNLPVATRFYSDVLELPLKRQDEWTSTFTAGAVDLVLQRRTALQDPQRCHDKYLLVFYTPNIVAVQDALIARGVSFKRPRPGYSAIGGSSRFVDSEGHQLCLYQPSAECLTWGSGAKVMELAHLEGGVDDHQLADRVPVLLRE
jgi:catechol 2,3-dioxygenase-like lactoylglutathione lyase family enzyme